MTLIDIEVYATSDEIAEKFEQAEKMGLPEPDINKEDLDLRTIPINLDMVCYMWPSANGTIIYFSDFEFVTPLTIDQIKECAGISISE